jgi:hypothetical protein
VHGSNLRPCSQPVGQGCNGRSSPARSSNSWARAASATCAGLEAVNRSGVRMTRVPLSSTGSMRTGAGSGGHLASQPREVHHPAYESAGVWEPLHRRLPVRLGCSHSPLRVPGQSHGAQHLGHNGSGQDPIADEPLIVRPEHACGWKVERGMTAIAINAGCLLQAGTCPQVGRFQVLPCSEARSSRLLPSYLYQPLRSGNPNSCRAYSRGRSTEGTEGACCATAFLNSFSLTATGSTSRRGVWTRGAPWPVSRRTAFAVLPLHPRKTTQSSRTTERGMWTPDPKGPCVLNLNPPSAVRR